MKKLLVVALCVAGALSVTAQGSLNFLNLNGPVSGVDGNLVGAGTWGQVYAGTDAGSLMAVGSPVESVGNGLFTGGVIDTGLPGGDAFVQLAAWSGGDSFDTATTSRGMSDVAPIVLATGIEIPPGLPTGAFSLDPVVIPEPSTYALAALGAGLLFLRRRK